MASKKKKKNKLNSWKLKYLFIYYSTCCCLSQMYFYLNKENLFEEWKNVKSLKKCNF